MVNTRGTSHPQTDQSNTQIPTGQQPNQTSDVRPPPATPSMEELLLQIRRIGDTIQLQNNVIQKVSDDQAEARREQAEARRMLDTLSRCIESVPQNSASNEGHDESQPGTQTAVRDHLDHVARQNLRTESNGRLRAKQNPEPNRQFEDELIVGPKGYTQLGYSTLPRSQRNNPLSEDIMAYPLPRLVHPVDIRKYDGSSDPGAHLSRFRTAMIPNSHEDAVMCRIFPTTLAGCAIDWFESLPAASVQNFDQLERMFVDYFSVSSHYHKDVTTLFQLKQGEGESLRSYMKRVGDAVSNTRDCTSEVATLACINGLSRGPLKFHVSRRRPRDFRELRRIAGEFIDAEDSLNSGPGSQQALSYADTIPGFAEQQTNHRGRKNRVEEAPSSAKHRQYTPLNKRKEVILREICAVGLATLPQPSQRPQG